VLPLESQAWIWVAAAAQQGVLVEEEDAEEGGT